MGGLKILSVSAISCLKEIDFIQPPGPSPRCKRLIQTVANQGRERMQERGGSRPEITVQPWSRVLVPLQGIYRTISSLGRGGGWKGGNFRLSPRFLELLPVTSSPTNQKKVCMHPKVKKTLSPPPVILPLKKLSWSSRMELEFWTHVCLLPRFLAS